jgi:hypothetical protein
VVTAGLDTRSAVEGLGCTGAGSRWHVSKGINAFVNVLTTLVMGQRLNSLRRYSPRINECSASIDHPTGISGE